MDLELKNKVVLVTGATGGIGSQTVKQFIEEGAKVVGVYNNQTSKAHEMESIYRDSLFMVKANLAVEDDVIQLFSSAEKYWGRIDVLVNNAGIWPEKNLSIAEMDSNRWHNTIAVNLDSVFYCSKYFLKQLKKYSGESANIIMIGSTAALFGEAGHGDYSVTKSALTYGMNRTLKNEITNYAPLGRVNVVCPGWVYTPMSENALKDVKKVKTVLQTIPLRKIASCEDIANSILTLASDKISGHISGQIITIAGGMEGRILYSEDQIDLEKIIPSHQK